MQTEEWRRKVKVEGTQYIRDAVLELRTETKLETGIGTVMMMLVSTRGERADSNVAMLFGFDENLQCRLFVQLPPEPAPGQYGLLDSSFAQLLGRFDQPTEDKLFLADSGLMVIDSLTAKNLFGKFSGYYSNSSGVPLIFDGRIRIKRTE